VLSVSLALVVAAVAACSSTTMPHDAPASSLYVYVSLQRALAPGPTTLVNVQMATKDGVGLVLTGREAVTLNGVAVPLQGEGAVRATLIGRVAPGAGGYTLTYTDGQGRRTTVHIPGPQQEFAVLQPTPGAHLALPALATAAAAVPTPSPVLQPRPPLLAHLPLTVRTTLPFLPTPSSADAHAKLGRYTIAASADGPCAPGWSRCQPIITQAGEGEPLPTGTITIDDRAAPWGDGFKTLAPGTGEVEATVSATWTLDDAGFAQLSVEYFDVVTVPVLWTAA
jgi:hypothetical protein